MLPRPFSTHNRHWESSGKVFYCHFLSLSYAVIDSYDVGVEHNTIHIIITNFIPFFSSRFQLALLFALYSKVEYIC